MLFDYCISNPPYQVEVRKAVNASGVGDTINIFPAFQNIGYHISQKVIMIYPGGRWIRQSGKGCKIFGYYLLNNSNLERLDYYNGVMSKDIFPSVAIGDGLSVVLLNRSYQNNMFYFNNYSMIKPGNGMIPLCDPSFLNILLKVNANYPSFNKRDSINNKPVFNDAPADEQLSFAVGDNPHPPEALKKPIKALINNMRGITGRTKLYWIEDTIHKNKRYAYCYKVAINSNVQGNETYNSWKFQILDSNTIVGASRIIIAYFTTEVEANNFAKYMDTVLMRKLLLAAGGARDRIGRNLLAFIPDIGDYSNNNSLFKSNDELGSHHEFFGLSMDDRLYKFFNLSYDEIELI